MPSPEEIFNATENFSEYDETKIVKSFTLIESPDMEHIDKIHRHPDVRDAERKRLRGYCDLAKKSQGHVEVEYAMYRKYGRYFVVSNKIFTGLTMNRRARSTFFGEQDSDLDLKSCHPKIMKSLCPKVIAKGLDYYIDHKDDFISQVDIPAESISKYNKKYDPHLTKKDFVKNLVTRTLYGGGTKNWFRDFELPIFKLPQIYWDLKQDVEFCTAIILNMERFKDHNKETRERYIEGMKVEYELANPIKTRYKKNEKKPEPFNPENIECPKRKMICVILQDIERQIIEEAMEFVKDKQGGIITMYAYDGFQIKNQGNSEDILKILNAEIGKKWDMEFDLKEFSEEYTDFHKIELPLYFNKKEFEYIVDEESKQKYFNKYIIKILSMDHFCYLGHDDIMKPIKNMKFFFNYLPHFDWVNNYIENSLEIPEYLTYDIYPNPKLCPSHIYNCWMGFEFEKKKYEDVDDEAELIPILYHMKVIANEIEIEGEGGPVTTYILNWLAHIVQKPERKTGTCILLQGNQGCGKTTIEILMRRILGEAYVFDTSDIEKIVGKFNSICKKKVLGVLNECACKDTIGVMEKIKDSITREKLLLEHKGLDPIPIKDYCNYVYTTNNTTNSIYLDADDRRFVIIECSKKHKGDTEYFNKLYNDNINNDAVCKTFFRFLKTRDITKFNPEKDRPITSHAKELHELNREPILDWFDWLFLPKTIAEQEFCEHPFNGDTTFKSFQLYCLFKMWWRKEGRKEDRIVNNKMFGRLLTSRIDDPRLKREEKVLDGYPQYTITFPKMESSNHLQFDTKDVCDGKGNVKPEDLVDEKGGLINPPKFIELKSPPTQPPKREHVKKTLDCVISCKDQGTLCLDKLVGPVAV